MDFCKVNLKDRSYIINIGRNLNIRDLVRQLDKKYKNIMIVTNTCVAPLYLDKIVSFLEEDDVNIKTCILEDGEQYKNVDSYMQVMTTLLNNNFARDCLLVALGGGVIGDITGFVASTFCRGVDFIQIPTTLLAMVDSSVGGKTAINHDLGKNMIGTFYQPKAVFIDLEFLKTLDERQIKAGLAEVIKYGIIYDKDFFNFLYCKEDLFDLDSNDLTFIVKKCCEIKALIVSDDERESGIRAILNLGHTFAHAIETHMGYGTYLHGEAVGIGIMLASFVAKSEYMLIDDEYEAIKYLLDKAKLSIKLPQNMGSDAFIEHMYHDKKVHDNKIVYVIPNCIGRAITTNRFSDMRIKELIDMYATIES